MAGTTSDDGELSLEEQRELAQAAQDQESDPWARDQQSEQAKADEFDAAAPDDDRDSPKTRASRNAPISDRTKARIRKLAREGMSRNGIARELKVSSATVSRVCNAAKPPIKFDRTETAHATAARVHDTKAQRVAIADQAAAEVRRLFTLLNAPHEVIHWDKDGFVHRAEIERPTSQDVKNYATAIGILTDKHLALVKFDSDDRDLPAVDMFLAAVTGGVLS